MTSSSSWSLFWPGSTTHQTSQNLASTESSWFCSYDIDGYILGFEDVSARITVCLPGIYPVIGEFKENGLHHDYNYPCGSLGDITVVAFWVSSSSSSKVDLTMMTVPIVSMTAVGPWWNEGRTYGQVIAYIPGKRYQSRFYSSSNTQVKSPFQLTLQRINEAHAIRQQLLLGKRVLSSSSGSNTTFSTAFAGQKLVHQNHDCSEPTSFSKRLGTVLTFFLKSKSFTYNHYMSFVYTHQNSQFRPGVSFPIGSFTLGIPLYITIWKLRSVFTSYYPHLLTIIQSHLHWLESFPVGFKLNVPLTKQMGCAILLSLQYYPYYLQLTGTIIIVLILVASVWLIVVGHDPLPYVSPITGITLFLASGLDLLQIITLPLIGISASVQSMHHHLLLLLRSLSLLLLSQKRNVLRNYRQDTMEYDFMQLLLGTILFVIGIFLIPTFFVYTVYTTLVFHLVLSIAPASVVWLSYVFLLAFPSHDILRCCKERIYSDIILRPLPSTSGLPVNVSAYLIESTRPISPASILAVAYAKHIQSFFSSTFGFPMLISLVFGKHVSVFGYWIRTLQTLKQS